MIDLLALALVLLTGLYLIGLGAVSLFAPARATFFLEGFASSARAHYVELVLRLGAGFALVTYAPRMRFSAAFARRRDAGETSNCMAHTETQSHRENRERGSLRLAVPSVFSV
jgi:hypothetical protein